MRFLGFLGKRRLDAARDLLPPQVEAWRQHWCFSNEAQAWRVSCDEERNLGEAALAGALDWWQADVEAGALHIAGSSADSWQHLVFGAHAGQVPDDASARHLLEQARLALVNALLQALGQAPVDSLTAQPPVAPGAPLGSRALLRIELADIQVHCLLDAALLNLALPALPAQNPLVERKNALGKARITLRLHLPLVELALGDINDLSPDDVLRARAQLDQPLALATEHGEALAKGYLARSQGHLALQLIN